MCVGGLAALALAQAAGPARAAGGPPSSRLSPQGWRTLEAFYRIDGGIGDTTDPARLHAVLQRDVGRCARLPGRGRQTRDIRRICVGFLSVADQLVAVQQCGERAGGTDEALALCVFGALPPMDRAADDVSGASGRIARSLAPGRCRTAFTRGEAQAARVSQAGSGLIAAAVGGDDAAAQAAVDAWSVALMRFTGAHSAVSRLDRSGCRP